MIGYDQEVGSWVERELGMVNSFGEYTAIGIVKNGELIAGVVYYCYRVINIEMAIASISPKWCTKKVLNLLFDYPFNQLGVKRVTTFVDSENQPVRAFNERLGFKLEGVLRGANPNGDAAIYGMLKNECRFL